MLVCTQLQKEFSEKILVAQDLTIFRFATKPGRPGGGGGVHIIPFMRPRVAFSDPAYGNIHVYSSIRVFVPSLIIYLR